MKSEDPHPQIAALLRSKQPEPMPSPGLETRILRELDRRQHRKPARTWPWLVLPPTFAAVVFGVLVSLPKPGGKVQQVTTQAPAKIEEEASPAKLLEEENPLKQETAALRRDAQRAGRFLIDCLPFGGAGDE